MDYLKNQGLRKELLIFLCNGFQAPLKSQALIRGSVKNN